MSVPGPGIGPATFWFWDDAQTNLVKLSSARVLIFKMPLQKAYIKADGCLFSLSYQGSCLVIEYIIYIYVCIHMYI